LPDQLFFDIVKMVVALACIVGLIYGVVYVLKRLLPGAMRSGGVERVDLQVLGQLGMGSRQRVAVIRVQDKTLVIGITEGSINTLAELAPPAPAARKEADDPKIFEDLLSWRKDGAAPAPRQGESNDAGVRNAEARNDNPLAFRPFLADDRAAAERDDRGDGPPLFAPREQPPR